jgi:hypothetical protein
VSSSGGAGFRSRPVIKVLTPQVQQGAVARIVVSAARATVSCGIDVAYQDGSHSSFLPDKSPHKGKVAWSWRVPRYAGTGAATIAVSCLHGGSAKARFFVLIRSTAASIAVQASGYTPAPHRFDSGTTIGYGLVLVNKSNAEAALNVKVGVNLVDASNRVIGTDPGFISAIPAGATYYYGSSVFTPGADPLARLEPVIQIGESEPKKVPSIPVDNVQVNPDTDDTTATVTGEFSNPFPHAIDEFAKISAVFFDASGTVIGGGFTLPHFQIPPGTRTAFRIDSDPVPASAIATVRVTVEPSFCGSTALGC